MAATQHAEESEQTQRHSRHKIRLPFGRGRETPGQRAVGIEHRYIVSRKRRLTGK